MPLDAFVSSLLAGSAAGMSVDMGLFPLDTLKTRLQSQAGFWKSGGFSGIYRGIGPAFVGSAPNAAVFFCTYDSCKKLLERRVGQNLPWVHMLSASIGEVGACVVRVPVEIVKQRRQVSHHSVRHVFNQVLKHEGFLGFYRGYFSTILREVPFSVIQFPLWEALKVQIASEQGHCSPFESSMSGAIAGGVAACLTTPLDVAKTRIMLAEAGTVESKGSIVPVLRIVYREKGISGLFAGVLPRTMWISIGGSIFFGTYELVKKYLADNCD
ncbi:S-adenosylmethionine mitochondrial carrier protein [Folsomia candida]|uniref:S-adenosylmethionine mitochondrial carrier protein n=1 Tax=Folsomia candida TaxID=158441 RepID=A0A226EPD8_FOLCA|nr:S-adenosylmethionine mitochondrial carrier protein [Folsomia candida]OXA59482.1 S-adenosylmethionine mitochondrial carrier protein [Folsomia candida]